MKFYVVIDTNVLVSALLSHHSDAATVRLIDRLFDGDFIPLYSDTIMLEYREVLFREKFHFNPGIVEQLLQTIVSTGIALTPSPTGELLIDKDDIPFYEVVMDTRDNDSYLVTGNLKHFPTKPFIVSVRRCSTFWTMLTISSNKTRTPSRTTNRSRWGFSYR